MRSLLVASAGGHLEELWLLRPRLSGLTGAVTWATWDTPQSRSILGDEDRVYVRRAQPRDLRTAVTNGREAWRILSSGAWDAVVSTGSLPAVPFLMAARALGIECHFIESAARVSGPSMTARILERVPGVHRYSQYDTWDRSAWAFRGSVFDGFVPRTGPPRPVRRVVVTLGSNDYGFRRLFDAARALLPADVEVLWQTGGTEVDDPGIEARRAVPGDELFDAMRNADLVIAHAGVGSAITAMRAGHCPILVPRRARFGEHVDDHQVQIADRLGAEGLALACDAGELDHAVLRAASSRRVTTDPSPTPFMLGGSTSEDSRRSATETRRAGTDGVGTGRWASTGRRATRADRVRAARRVRRGPLLGRGPSESSARLTSTGSTGPAVPSPR